MNNELNFKEFIYAVSTDMAKIVIPILILIALYRFWVWISNQDCPKCGASDSCTSKFTDMDIKKDVWECSNCKSEFVIL